LIYTQVIEKVRQRGFKWLQGTHLWQLGSIYDAINDAIRDLALSKNIESSATSLAIVAGTRDYTISSAIGTDVQEIVQIDLDTGEIRPKTIWAFQEELHTQTLDEDDLTQGTPEYFRVWGGILRLVPTPSTTATATVYYSKNVAQGFYSTSNGAATVPVNDTFINALIYETLAILSEEIGDVKSALYYRQNGRMKLDEALIARASYNSDTIKYQDPVDGNAGTVRVIQQE
jgi:hypothetical protein